MLEAVFQATSGPKRCSQVPHPAQILHFQFCLVEIRSFQVVQACLNRTSRVNPCIPDPIRSKSRASRHLQAILIFKLGNNYQCTSTPRSQETAQALPAARKLPRLRPKGAGRLPCPEKTDMWNFEIQTHWVCQGLQHKPLSIGCSVLPSP